MKVGGGKMKEESKSSGLEYRESITRHARQ